MAKNATAGIPFRDARPISGANTINPWSPGGSFMVQKMGITPPIPIL